MLFTAVHSKKIGGTNRNERQTECKEKLCIPEDSQTLNQTNQGGCAGSVFGGFQDQKALSDLIWCHSSPCMEQ